jgi:hypothetical protein
MDTEGSGFEAIVIAFKLINVAESKAIATFVSPDKSTIVMTTTKRVVPSAIIVPSLVVFADHASAAPSAI